MGSSMWKPGPGHLNKFLDLFCGSGSVSIKAFKKGFNITAIEIQRKQFLTLKKMFNRKNLEINLICNDAIKFLNKTNVKFDVIFIDPPYEKIIFYHKCLEIIFRKNLLNKNGVIILEKSSRLSLQIDFRKYNFKQYFYGDTELVVIG